ncbi:hypothetical protein MSM1_01010 [Mycobacterium sp. SM1]|uniref:hypothetical protein n=1 Tax=Mycobacterium sp. SM1 TaxID=2816243 RepID=UPI001BD02ABB|nr:hypothetical protein [Mycobacterium sp. SM1]MBS4727007.1 hypothetical protein [Mycobacterium sp. SM1]
MRFPKGHEVRALGIAAATAMAFAPLAVVATAAGPALAAPCAGAFANPVSCQNCLLFVQVYHTSNVCEKAMPPHPAQAPPSRMPAPTPEVPLESALPEPVPPITTPSQIPQVVSPTPPPPSTSPGRAPTINPPASGAPRNAPLVTPPKELDAPPQAVAAAKAAPETRINPAAPPAPPTHMDFNHQVQNAINAPGGNVDLVKADNRTLVYPRHWDYLDYDDYRRPTLYNPLGQAMTFRYFYAGAYREVYVPAGGRIVLDVATVGLFPFTAVGGSYLASGSFYGGAWIPPDGWNGSPPPTYTPQAPPEVHRDVLAYIPAANQVVEVGQVEVVGHDDSQPAGGQDTFLLDDSTLAWGQIDDPGSGAQIRVTKTQPLPGVGPTDNGTFLVALAAHQEPTQPARPWWPMALGYGVLAIAAGVVAWMISRGYAAHT